MCSKVRSPAAERYRALRAAGIAPGEAERQAFSELVPDPIASAEELYAAFLREARPEAVRQHGIYATPNEVVQAQVRLVDELLRTCLDCREGFADERVFVVDPASGHGAYPSAIVQRAGQSVIGRMALLETMPGAAAIARRRGLPVRECDALHTELDIRSPVVVCIGNPPYRRRPGSDAARAALDGFVSADGGIHRKNLYNEYVYFWRWALRLVFEDRQGPGVICFVTAGSYVHGPAFGGMRQTLRRLVDELWVLDLEGDNLAARASDNVFPIRTPVAIALAVRYAARSGVHRGHYARLSGSADSKRAALDRIQHIGDVRWINVDGVGSEPLRPARASKSSYFRWPALTELFPWQLSGAQLKRTWPIGVSPEVLQARWQRFLDLPEDERAAAFGSTRDRTIFSSPPDLREPGRRLRPLAELEPGSPCLTPVPYAYRAFDRQWVLPDARLGDYFRPTLWRALGDKQVFLTTMLTNVLGPGPAAVATGLVPDLDHFRGSFGARGVIPLWRDAEATQANVSSEWLDRLSDRYGFAVTAPRLMSYCYALLSAPSYTRRFEAELRTPGPHIPLAREHATFLTAVALGERLLDLHAYRAGEPGEAAVTATLGDVWPTKYRYERESVSVGDGRIGPVPRQAWEYRVSGYPVLGGWLRQRISKPARPALDAIRPSSWSAELSRELLELVWLLEATLAAQPVLDQLLDEAVSGSCV